MPASVLAATLRQAAKEGDGDALRAVREVALRRGAEGRQYDPNRADALRVDETTWPIVNLFEGAFGEGGVFEPYSPSDRRQPTCTPRAIARASASASCETDPARELGPDEA